MNVCSGRVRLRMALVDGVSSSLAKTDRLDLLPSVFETVETPPSVIGELNRAEVDGYEFRRVKL